MDQSDRDHVAAYCAVGSWCDPDKPSEGSLARELQASSAISGEQFNRWVVKWRLRAFWTVKDRIALATFLKQVAEPRLMRVRARALLRKAVDELAEEAKPYTRGKLTSLMSKFAMGVRPDELVPYDSRVYKALCEAHGYRLNRGEYEPYARAFEDKAAEIFEDCRRKGITPQSLPYAGRALNEPVFALRVADKRLMLDGGFSPTTMRKEADEAWAREKQLLS